MLYSMPLVADDGRRFHLDGYKQIRDDDGLDLWSDTTTLYVTVHEGEGTTGPVAAKGIVTIHAADFAKQMTTMRGRRRQPARPAQGDGDVRPDVHRGPQRVLRRRLRPAQRLRPGRRAARAPRR